MINKTGVARDLVWEYIEAHPGQEFTLEDVRAWGNQYQYDLSRELIGKAIRDSRDRGELARSAGKNSKQRPVWWKAAEVWTQT